MSQPRVLAAVPSAAMLLRLLAVPLIAVAIGTGAAAQDDGERQVGRPTPPPARPQVPAPATRPPVTLEPSNIDLGFLPPKTIGRALFTLTNTSNAPLTILDASPTCRCTTVGEHVGAVLKPNEPYTIEVRLDPATVPQSRSASVRILFDGYTRTIDLVVRGEVSNPLRTNPGWINVPGDERPSGRMVVESIDGTAFRICTIHGHPVRFLGFDPASDEPRTNYVIEYDLAVFGEQPLPGWLIIETDHPTFPVVDVRLRTDSINFNVGIRGIRDFRIPLGRIAPSGSAETSVEFGGLRQRLEFISAESLSDDAVVEFIGQEDEPERTLVKIRVTPREDHCGLLYFPVRLHTADASQEVILFATVTETGCGGEVVKPAAAAAPSE